MNLSIGTSTNTTPTRELHEWKPLCFPEDSFIIVTIILRLILVVPIILGNTMIIIAILRFRRMRTRTNAFIFNLALADMMVGVVILYDTSFYFVQTLSFNKWTCLFRYYFFIVSMGSSVFCLLVLSTDRYMAILHPMLYSRLVTKSKTTFLIITGWTYILVLCMLPVMGWNTWKPSLKVSI